MTLVRKIILGSLIPIALLAGWWAMSARSSVVPSIGSVLGVLADPFTAPPDLDTTSLAAGAWISVLRVGLGFGLAAISGIAAGFLIGMSRRSREILAPTMSVALAISPIAWLPVSIIVFGLATPASVMFGPEAWRYNTLDQLSFAVVAVIWYGAFFPIAMNTAAGVRGVRKAHIETVRVLGATRMQTLTKIILPASMPAIFTGLRIGAGISWRVIVAAEIFPGTRSGLGYMISASHEIGEYRYAFAAIVVIGLIGLVLDGIFRLLAWRVGHWQPKER
jgi:NitT/TauT family transport system permease protein